MKKLLVDQILKFTKVNTEITAAMLAAELQQTKEGARLNLLKLVEEELIVSFGKSEGVGRPITYYKLTDKGLSRLPDAHAEVTVELLHAVKTLLGDNALDLLISEREKKVYARYEKHLEKAISLEQKLDLLTQIRSEEGYMAHWEHQNGVYFLIENHCPICAAATVCQGFCRTELANFKALLGQEHTVERISHLLTEGQRCVYKITLTTSGDIQ
ncbi:MarR family transcriptional regulator [Myroides sp. 1354]|uniref:helix-turn-helix transcriptional regulator n=1 Tax=unclassified Myroides TaxID=2642485 RepID=UPI002576FCE4|nr:MULTISPECIES: MarR family transcriptional regulator [unclassified Myroides]MDM1046465.1 MarR family transcriptional regulator [Myroides sp. R163-1]MDM1057412.1 MarR family transcriptional regulator [Myroides sp. 1354]MDM1070697.1 MarR family transcriptional regulator [Myroides sp. 1372]